MSRLNKIGKWLLVLFTILFVIYTLFWVLVTYTIANNLHKTYAGKKFALSEGATVYFEKARAAGYPFKFMVDFIGFEEENEETVITHKAPFTVGYNLLRQVIFSEYQGDSIAKHKPLESGFGARVEGKYRIQAKVPFNSTLIQVFLSKAEPIEMINYVNDFNLTSRDVHIYDLIDKSIIIKDADLDLKFSVLHNKYYDTLDELLEDIPDDYLLSFSATTKDAAPARRPVPFSVIYWTYLPTDFTYDIDLDFHTKAKHFSFEDIFDNFSVKTNKLDFYSKMESSKSELFLKRFNKNGSEHKIEFNYKTKLKLGQEFNEHISTSIQQIMDSIPPNSPALKIEEFLQRMDLAEIDLSTGEDEIDFHISANINKEAEKTYVDVSRLEISVKDKGIGVKARLSNNFAGEWINGIVQVLSLEEVTEYITKSYFRIFKERGDPIIMTDNFWVSLYVDYLKLIANNYNEDNGSATFEFKMNKDVEKSIWGKYTAPESDLFFYRKLYAHLKPYTSSENERLEMFRRMVPSSVDSPEILTKITKEGCQVQI